MGLINMRERVAALAGTIALEDVPGGGLRVRIIIPASAGTDTKTSTSQELRT
jgi:signal transduction histidine kinase